jgi:hypothetical protein
MIFTNLTWDLSSVHPQLGAKIVIRCMSEDSCKDFSKFLKGGSAAGHHCGSFTQL